MSRLEVFQPLLWGVQVLQSTVGILCIHLLHCKYQFTYDGIRVYSSPILPGRVSFGLFIILREDDMIPSKSMMISTNVFKHEYGHSIQSAYLGPLYLFVIGIPSLLWYMYTSVHKGCNYYSFYTERWADKLGSVIR